MPLGAHLELDVLHLWRLFRVEAGVLKAQERTRVSGLDLFLRSWTGASRRLHASRLIGGTCDWRHSNAGCLARAVPAAGDKEHCNLGRKWTLVRDSSSSSMQQQRQQQHDVIGF